MNNGVLKTLVSAMLIAGVASTATAGVTGNINVVSSYDLRGMGSALESSTPAVQGGLDYSHDSGLYAGYWMSTLSYSYDRANEDLKSMENDFYAGYNGKVGDLGYTVGATYYYYGNGERGSYGSDGAESKLGVSYGPLSVTAQTILSNVYWANVGDTYFLGTLTQALPQDFTFTGQLGYNTYSKNSNEKAQATKKSSGFKHLTLGVSHPLGAKGATMGLQYIIGGYDRMGMKHENQVVGSLGMTF